MKIWKFSSLEALPIKKDLRFYRNLVYYGKNIVLYKKTMELYQKLCNFDLLWKTVWFYGEKIMVL